MRRSNKLKVPPAVRAAARQAVNTQEIKGLGKPKLRVTDGVAASQMRQQFRDQKRPKWLFREGDMVRVRNPNNILENLLGMVISIDQVYEADHPCWHADGLLQDGQAGRPARGPVRRPDRVIY